MKTTCLVITLALFTMSCGGLPGLPGQKKDAATACEDLCSDNGFSSSRVEEASHETNCYCSGGSGEITQDECAEACTSMDKDNAQAFGTSATAKDACQCS